MKYQYDWALIGFVALIITVVVLSYGFPSGSQGSPLDKAQAAFELVEGPKGYSFNDWRRSGDMSCQNAPTLRNCRAHPVVTRSPDGDPSYLARDFLSFACSTTECAWVDP